MIDPYIANSLINVKTINGVSMPHGCNGCKVYKLMLIHTPDKNLISKCHTGGCHPEGIVELLETKGIKKDTDFTVEQWNKYLQENKKRQPKTSIPSKKTGRHEETTNRLSSNTKFTAQTLSSSFLNDITTLTQRQWIITGHFLRGYVSCTFAPGGVGKSTFNLVLGISIASGRDLLGLGVEEQCNVLIINNEDDNEELQRRIAGILIAYDIEPSEIEDKLYYFSGYGSSLMVVQKLDDRTIMATPDVTKIKEFIKQKSIGMLYVDPFISTHDLGENDNTDIDKVVGTFKNIAYETRCSVSLTHHTRKLGGNDSEAHAGDADIGRGATSLKDAARCVETLARMSIQSAKKIDFEPSERVRHIRLDNGKSNFGLPEDSALWFRMDSVMIPNGDFVGVPKPVNLSPMFEKARSKDGRVKWTPTLVAEAVHRLIKNDDTLLTDILYQFKAENNISNTQAREIIHMLGNDESNSTMIRVNGTYYRYHYSKKNKTAPIIIHRREQ